MVSAINPNRIVPVTEDLTTPEDNFEIIRGWEKMHRRDFPLATGAEFLPGEWAVLNNTGTLERAPAAPTAATPLYLVLAGTDRFDVAANQAATIIMASNVVVRTKRFNDGGSYSIGTLLTARDWSGSGASSVDVAAAGRPIVGRVTAVDPNGAWIEYETFYGGVAS